MRGNISLRLTGLYLWAGQLFGLVISLLLTEPTKGFWLWHIVLAFFGFSLLIAFNLKYWLWDIRMWRLRRMWNKFNRKGMEGKITTQDLTDIDNARGD